MTQPVRNLQHVVVYQNIYNHLIPFQGMEVISEPLARKSPPDIDNLTSVFMSQGYWRIDARAKDKVVVIIILGPNYPWRDKGTFVQFLRGVTTGLTRDYPLREVFLIGDDALQTKKNLVGALPDVVETINAPVHIYPYSCFMHVVPDYPMVFPHRKITDEETQKVLNFYQKKVEEFSKIKVYSDPAAVWYGLKPGGLVEVKVQSENAIQEILYLHAVP